MKKFGRNSRLRSRVLRICLYFTLGIIVCLFGFLCRFLFLCVRYSDCGVLQEPRGIIGIASVLLGNFPGKPPVGSDCGCHTHDMCHENIIDLEGSELTPEMLRERPSNELNPPFLDRRKYFPGSAHLEKHYKAIQADAYCLIRQAQNVPSFDKIEKKFSRIGTKGKTPWRTFVVKAWGSWFEENTRIVPATTRLLKEAGGDSDLATVMFSIMEPGKEIPPHCGPFKTELRYHLNLIIPETSQPYIQVDHFRYYWKEGEGVIFDDTFGHEAHNTDQEEWRVILFVGVYRHDLGRWPHWIHRFGEYLLQFNPDSQISKQDATSANLTPCPDIEMEMEDI